MKLEEGRFGVVVATFVLAMMCAPVQVLASSIKIVAIGASNTLGWGISSEKAYPARLQALLRAQGYDVEVRNAGVSFDTTAGMLARLNAEVPDGIRVVIIQPGGNDRRFLIPKERRAANIDAMVAKLKARNIRAIVYDPVFEQKYYQWDAIHINTDGHAMIAQTLLPQVISAIGRRK
jgi:acyl-CoA thioesterase I